MLEICQRNKATTSLGVISECWWDARKEGTFFPRVYRIGDRSKEGNLLSLAMGREERTLRECNFVERLGKPAAACAIVDCPCGTGRHAIELASRGYNVSGVDLDPRAIQEAERKSVRRQLNGPAVFLEGDMRALPLTDGCADLVINMFFSFGFFGEDPDNLQVLREFSRVLRPGGRLLIHTDVNPTRLETASYGDRTTRTLIGGGELVVEEQFDFENRRLYGLWRLEEPRGDTREATYSVRIYADEELNGMCEEAGFSRICRWNIGPTGVTQDRLAEEVVYVAVKESEPR